MAADEIRGAAQGSAPVPLSVLDLVTVGAGRTASDALRTSVDLARLAEARGFHRYWVAEHHSMPGVASSSPAVILAHLAAHTDRIRLGSGGVMLPNHAPLVIAEQFGTLEAMAPGRVDLGLGRAPGTDGATAAALRRTDRLNEGADDFPAAARRADPLPRRRLPRRAPVPPYPRRTRARSRPRPPAASSPRTGRPSGCSAPPASAPASPASSGCPSPSRTTSRRRTPSPPWTCTGSPSSPPPCSTSRTPSSASPPSPPTRRRRPAARCCAAALSMVRLRTGRPGLVPSPEEAEAYEFSPMERDFVDSWNANVIHGTPDEVRSGLDDLAKRTGADELMITANAHGGDVRLRSLRTHRRRLRVADARLNVRRRPAARRCDPATPDASTASPVRCRSRCAAAGSPAPRSPRTRR